MRYSEGRSGQARIGIALTLLYQLIHNAVSYAGDFGALFNLDRFQIADIAR